MIWLVYSTERKVIVYIDRELAEVMTVALNGAEQLNNQIEKVRGHGAFKDNSTPVHDCYLSTMVIWASGEPYAVIRTEDVWQEANILPVEEQEVVKRATEMLVSPHRFVEEKKAADPLN